VLAVSSPVESSSLEESSLEVELVLAVEEESSLLDPQAAKQVAVINTAATKANAFSFIVLTSLLIVFAFIKIACKKRPTAHK
jgi:hypothetical protein